MIEVRNLEGDIIEYGNEVDYFTAVSTMSDMFHGRKSWQRM